jgi:hydroxymethylpyrimidine pyrophosphatase-like HAD family hydrolase
VDVDGTLIKYYDQDNPQPTMVNENIRSLVITLAGFQGVEIYVWSGGGVIYARQIVNEIGLKLYIKDVIEKGSIIPDVVIDDEPGTKLGKINFISTIPSEIEAEKRGATTVMNALGKRDMLSQLPDDFFDEISTVM